MNHLLQRLASQVRRRQRARRQRRDSVWLGLATPGMVGWTISVCTVGGLALGIYLDAHYPAHLSWTLTGLGLGLVLGCLQAWLWVDREHQRMFDNRPDSSESTPPRQDR